MKTGQRHVAEYAMEAALLGTFMVMAVLVTALLEHPSSLLHRTLPDPFVRRMLIGIAMGLTAVILIYSPWGRRSGAHMNPAVTLTFWRLGKVKTRDALGYAAAQFAGGSLGVVLAHGLLGDFAAHSSVRFAVTVPGTLGAGVAFAAEAMIAGLLMLTVLSVSSSARWAPYTGCFAGVLVALYITFEAPLSGMSMNPARTFASAWSGGVWTEIWIYFTAPPLGMLAGAALFTALRGARQVACAKLVHDPKVRCIFCGHPGK